MIPCININCKEIDFIKLIFDEKKIIETRTKNTLRSLVGKRIGLIRTGCGKAMLVGYCDIDEVIKYNNVTEFRKDYKKHLVKKGSKYDIKKGGVKYGYVLSNVEQCEPMFVTAKGIVIRYI